MSLRSVAGFIVCGFGLVFTVVNQAWANDLPDRPPAEFLMEMSDPGMCKVPQAEVSDAEVLDMIDSDDPQMTPPVSGTWEQNGKWQAVGQSSYNNNSNGLVSSIALILRNENDQLRYLCMLLARHVDTDMIEGQAALVGPEKHEEITGNTFMVVALVGDREEGEFIRSAELLTDEGSLIVNRVDDNTLAGKLSLLGVLDGPERSAPVRLELDLDEIWHFDGMRIVDWTHDY